MLNKEMTAADVVAQLRDGMTIGIGGWGPRRKPMAIVREILRSPLKDLTVVVDGGTDIGRLCAAGKVKKLIYGCVSLDFISLEPFFRKAREKHPLEYVPFSPELVGQKPVGIVIGKNSGLPSVQEWCEKMKIDATEEQMMAMIPLIKEKSFKKKDLLTEDEFKKIVDQVLKRKAS